MIKVNDVNILFYVIILRVVNYGKFNMLISWDRCVIYII